MVGHCPHGRLDPRVKIQLFQQVFDVYFYRGLGDAQCVGYLFVAAAGGDLSKNLPFAIGQLGLEASSVGFFVTQCPGQYAC